LKKDIKNLKIEFIGDLWEKDNFPFKGEYRDLVKDVLEELEKKGKKTLEDEKISVIKK
jgi:hypothetical protein